MKMPDRFCTAKGCCLLLTIILTLVYFLLLSGTYPLVGTGMFELVAAILGVAILVMWVSVLACKK